MENSLECCVHQISTALSQSTTDYRYRISLLFSPPKIRYLISKLQSAAVLSTAEITQMGSGKKKWVKIHTLAWLFFYLTTPLSMSGIFASLISICPPPAIWKTRSYLCNQLGLNAIQWNLAKLTQPCNNSFYLLTPLWRQCATFSELMSFIKCIKWSG